jgi:hypothetical protein
MRVPVDLAHTEPCMRLIQHSRELVEILSRDGFPRIEGDDAVDRD